MASKKFLVSLTYEVWVSGDREVMGKGPLSFALSDRLRQWRDGRYPFEVEQIQNGIAEAVRSALYMAEVERQTKNYGDEKVISESGAKASRAWIEATEIARTYEVHCHADPYNFSLDERN